MVGPFDDYIKRARELIAQHGWMVQAVLPDENQPSFSYTVGLSQAPFYHPEIFLVGFHPDQARPLLNVAGSHVKSGLRFDRTTFSDQIIEGNPTCFRPIKSRSAIRNSNAGRAILGRAFDGVQLILPDAEGRFPWEDGCDPSYATMQMSLLHLAADPPAR
jgi:hypothetical protein